MMDRRGAFTLVEIMAVIAIIALLTGIGLPAYGIWQRSAKANATQRLVQAIAAAAAAYPVRAIAVRPDAGQPATGTRALWDLNGDRLLDGDPALDPAFDAATRIMAAASGYTGPLRMMNLGLPATHVDAQGRVLDAWKRTIHIARASMIYGPDGVGLWSAGPDGIDGNADDITSWSTKP